MENYTAATILHQLGGNRFIAMTGSKNFISKDNALIMTLTSNKSGAKYLKVKLTPLDAYDMKFYTVDKNFDQVIKVEYKNVYFDQLEELFTEATGLYTSL